MTAAARKRLFILSTIAVLALLVLGVGVRMWIDASAAGAPPAPVRWPRVTVKPVGVASLSEQVTVAGLARPVRQAEMRAEVRARVMAVHVRIGDIVHAGTVLLEQDDEQQAAAWQQALADLRAREADAGYARLDLTSKRALWDEQRNVDFGITENDIRRAEQVMAAAEAAVDSANAALRRARAQLAQTAVVAPFDGVVVARDVDPGDLPSPGDHLVTVADVSALEIELAVSASDVAAIDGEAPIEGIRIASRSEPVAGRITAISPVADAAGLFELRVEVTNAGVALPAAEPATDIEYVGFWANEVVTEPPPPPLRRLSAWPADMLFGGVSARVPVPRRTLQSAVVVPEQAVVRTAADETYVVVVRRRTATIDYFGPQETGYEETAEIVFVDVERYADGMAVIGHATAEGRIAEPPGLLLPEAAPTIRPLVAVSNPAALRDGERVVIIAGAE